MVVVCGGGSVACDGGDGVGVSGAVVVMAVLCGDGGDDGGGVWRRW